MSPESAGKISRIAYYPVKGISGLEVENATLTKEGIVGDRQFMIVRSIPDESGVHEFVTQRDKRDEKDKPQGLSVLAKIKPQIALGIIRDELILNWDGNEPIIVSNQDHGEELAVRVWDSICIAVDQGDEISNWLSDHLKTDVRLVKAAGSFERPVSQKWLANDSTVRFQDGYPIHWISQESLNELSEKAEHEISWQSFRPNIVVEGLPTQEEHKYHSGEIAGIPFLQPKPCDRCPVTNVDQRTGEITVGRALAPLATYKSWRKSPEEVKVIFGENMLPQGEGEIRVGDKIVLVDLREPPLVYGKRSEV